MAKKKAAAPMTHSTMAATAVSICAVTAEEVFATETVIVGFAAAVVVVVGIVISCRETCLPAGMETGTLVTPLMTTSPCSVVTTKDALPLAFSINVFP